MVKLNIINIFDNDNKNAPSTNFIDFPEELLSIKCAKKAVQMVYYVDYAIKHHSTAHTKERWAVSGTTKKTYKQKGTGKARHSTLRAAQFRGGGITFGPIYAEKKMKINKNARTVATLACLNDHVKRGTIFVVDNFSLNEPKTKKAFAALSNLLNYNNISNSLQSIGCLLVGDSNDLSYSNFALATKNLIGVKFISDKHINVTDFLCHGIIVMTRSALENVIHNFNAKMNSNIIDNY